MNIGPMSKASQVNKTIPTAEMFDPKGLQRLMVNLSFKPAILAGLIKKCYCLTTFLAITPPS